MTVRGVFCSLAVLCLAGQGALADVLVLRDGRRVEGTLVAVRGDTIEFREGDRRLRRYDRDEVRSIQFDDDREDAGRGGRGALRERVATVDARLAWTDTGVDVRAGQDVLFSSSGEIRWGPNRRDGAAGERNSPRNSARPMPDRNAAALIGKVGENGDPFFIGDARDLLRMRASGRIFLGLNDDYLADNSGSLRVVIAY